MSKTYFRDPDFLKAFGRKLREVRLAKNITQEELANLADFPLSQIGRIERGELNTSISHVSAIAKALNITPRNLFDF